MEWNGPFSGIEEENEKSAKRKKEREGVNRQGEKVQEHPWCDHDDDGRGQEFCFGDCAEDEESYSCPSGYKIVIILAVPKQTL